MAGRARGAGQEGEHSESVNPERCKLGRKAMEDAPTYLPPLLTLTLLATLGGLFLRGTLPARLNWLPVWLQREGQGQRCLWEAGAPSPAPLRAPT